MLHEIRLRGVVEIATARRRRASTRPRSSTALVEQGLVARSARGIRITGRGPGHAHDVGPARAGRRRRAGRTRARTNASSAQPRARSASAATGRCGRAACRTTTATRDYDWSVIDRSSALDERVAPVVSRLGRTVERFAAYRPRLRAALERVDEGDDGVAHVAADRLVPHGVDADARRSAARDRRRSRERTRRRFRTAGIGRVAVAHQIEPSRPAARGAPFSAVARSRGWRCSRRSRCSRPRAATTRTSTAVQLADPGEVCTGRHRRELGHGVVARRCREPVQRLARRLGSQPAAARSCAWRRSTRRSRCASSPTNWPDSATLGPAPVAWVPGSTMWGELLERPARRSAPPTDGTGRHVVRPFTPRRGDARPDGQSARLARSPDRLGRPRGPRRESPGLGRVRPSRMGPVPTRQGQPELVDERARPDRSRSTRRRPPRPRRGPSSGRSCTTARPPATRRACTSTTGNGSRPTSPASALDVPLGARHRRAFGRRVQHRSRAG